MTKKFRNWVSGFNDKEYKMTDSYSWNSIQFVYNYAYQVIHEI